MRSIIFKGRYIIDRKIDKMQPRFGWYVVFDSLDATLGNGGLEGCSESGRPPVEEVLRVCVFESSFCTLCASWGVVDLTGTFKLSSAALLAADELDGSAVAVSDMSGFQELLYAQKALTLCIR